MIPIVVFWTKHTATLQGRVLKLVPCENCSTEYVYVLEREGEGVGTSVYLLNEEGAQDNAASAADESLKAYLENDFDPIPCPVCGHYQRYMFSKLYETRSPWMLAARLVVLGSGCLDVVGTLYWTIAYVQHPSNLSLRNMIATLAILAALLLTGLGLAAIERSRVRRFDPNLEDQQSRIAKGKSRAVPRAEFDAAQLTGRAGQPSTESQSEAT